MPTERLLVGNVISILDHAVIDTYVQRTRPGRYTCQINQLISRQDSKERQGSCTANNAISGDDVAPRPDP